MGYCIKTLRGKRGMRLTAKHRVYLSIVILTAYVLLFNYYLWAMTHGMNEHYYRLLYYYITAVFTSIYLLDRKMGIVSFIHEQFNFLLILCVLINYVLIILTRHCIIDTNWKPMFWSFNGGVLFVTISVLINGIKRKIHEW